MRPVIRTGAESDLLAVARLEKVVEAPNAAASLDLLRSRLRVYPLGFFVACDGEQVIGYLESIRCDVLQIERFDQVRDFEKIYRPNGSMLYLGYFAVDPKYRKFGIAVYLMEAVENLVRRSRIEKIQLVALPHLSPFYRFVGFREVRSLPDFLPQNEGMLMEKIIDPK